MTMLPTSKHPMGLVCSFFRCGSALVKYYLIYKIEKVVMNGMQLGKLGRILSSVLMGMLLD